MIFSMTNESAILITLLFWGAIIIAATGVVFLFINAERRQMGLKMIFGSVAFMFLVYYIGMSQI